MAWGNVATLLCKSVRARTAPWLCCPTLSGVTCFRRQSAIDLIAWGSHKPPEGEIVDFKQFAQSPRGAKLAWNNDFALRRRVGPPGKQIYGSLALETYNCRWRGAKWPGCCASLCLHGATAIWLHAIWGYMFQAAVMHESVRLGIPQAARKRNRCFPAVCSIFLLCCNGCKLIMRGKLLKLTSA